MVKTNKICSVFYGYKYGPEEIVLWHMLETIFLVQQDLNLKLDMSFQQQSVCVWNIFTLVKIQNKFAICICGFLIVTSVTDELVTVKEWLASNDVPGFV